MTDLERVAMQDMVASARAAILASAQAAGADAAAAGMHFELQESESSDID